MVRTESTMRDLGSPAPEFRLPATDGKNYSPANLKGPHGLLIVFFCNHCPYAIAVRDRLIAIAKEFTPRGLGMALINSNDANEYPADSFENMKTLAAEKDIPCPYLYDESQETAKAYLAACTPDPYLYDGNLKLYYRGRVDDGGREGRATTNDLHDAIEAMLAGRPAPEQQHPSIGCNIKWKDGVFPEYMK